jgi:hypothetical protein
MRYKTYKLQKLEKSRKESLFTDDMDHCYLCNEEEPIPKDDIHEVYQGRNRHNSIKYKLIIPVCRKHHDELHDNQQLQNILKKQGQILFEQNYDIEFVSIFYKNYK